jgi:hypothetical protein
MGSKNSSGEVRPQSDSGKISGRDEVSPLNDPDAVLTEVVPVTRSNESTLLPEDYYLDENGNIVFTAVYHLKRGTCCGSGCRHCPF